MSTDINQSSQSLSKIWELSLYELHRNPQKVIDDDSDITVSTHSLNSELMCPICLDMLKNTMTTKECLHRFCQECIITALRSGNKECPTCRKKLVSKRSLRPDPNFDSLIAKIHPYREEYEAQRDKKWAKISSQTIKKCSILHSKDKTSGKQSANLDTSSNMNLLKGESSAADIKSEDENQIELIFKPHPDENCSTTKTTIFSRFLKTTPNATVEHLAKYVTMRIALEKDKTNGIVPSTLINSMPLYSIYIYGENNDYIELDPVVTLGDVYLKYWKMKKPMLIFYFSKESS